MTETSATAQLERAALPYLPFDTFRNFVEGLEGRPLPPRIDRSLMAGTAGGTQTLLLAALIHLELIADDRSVLPPFRELVVAESDDRQRLMEQLLRRTYPAAMTLAREHATADQLAECFRSASGYQGSTLRKAITFFLNMAKYAQVDLSPFFRSPAQTPGPRKAVGRRPRNSTMAHAATDRQPAVPTVAPVVEARSIDLVSGGTVTISCSVSFLSLSRSDREFVFGLVDSLDGYSAEHPSKPGLEIPQRHNLDSEAGSVAPTTPGAD